MKSTDYATCHIREFSCFLGYNICILCQIGVYGYLSTICSYFWVKATQGDASQGYIFTWYYFILTLLDLLLLDTWFLACMFIISCCVYSVILCLCKDDNKTTVVLLLYNYCFCSTVTYGLCNIILGENASICTAKLFSTQYVCTCIRTMQTWQNTDNSTQPGITIKVRVYKTWIT